MSLQERKQKVLEQLAQERKPISLSDLLRQLGDGFKERSIRRWLDALILEGKVQKIGRKRGTQYIACREQEGIASKEAIFSLAGLQIIEKIKRPLFEKSPVTYVESWLESYRPNVDFYLPVSIRDPLAQSGKRAGMHDPAGTYAHQIFHRLLIDLSYNSSRLEGNTYSLLDTERLLLRGDSAEGKLDEERIMILNHKEAIRYVVDSAYKLDISLAMICTLHYLLSDGLIDSAEAGKIRRHEVRIGGSVYRPYEGVKRLERQLEKIAHKAALIQDPFEQSIFLLVHISYLQAFSDVNKRTARLAANVPLIKGNLVPLAFSDIRVDDYMSAMIAIYELQDVRPLVDLYVYSYLRTCAMYDLTIQAIGLDAIRVRYRQQRRQMIRDIILQGKVGEELMQCVSKEAKKQIPQEELSAFVEDLQEDLEQMDESRLAGLGVDVDQLATWLRKATGE